MEQSVSLERLSKLNLEANPALRDHARKRAESVQNRMISWQPRFVRLDSA